MNKEEQQELIDSFSFKDYFEEGEVIYGFCNGYFGRDDYETKRVLKVKKNYIIFEYEDESLLTSVEEGRYLLVKEYNLLQKVSFVNKNKDGDYNMDLEYLKTMFNNWKKRED